MQCRPSDMLHIKGSIRAYCLDRAVWLFGSTLDSELEDVSNKAKNERSAAVARTGVLNRWFPESKAAPGRYRDPAKL